MLEEQQQQSSLWQTTRESPTRGYYGLEKLYVSFVDYI